MTSIWAVTINSDLTEGRGRQYAKALCVKEATAKRLAHKADVQGCDGTVQEIQVLSVAGKDFIPLSLFILEQPTDADHKAQVRLDDRKAAVARALELGLTHEDLAILRS